MYIMTRADLRLSWKKGGQGIFILGESSGANRHMRPWHGLTLQERGIIKTSAHFEECSQDGAR